MLNETTLKLFRLAIPADESGETGKRDFQDTEVLLYGFLEVATPEFAALNDGEYTRLFRFFMDESEIDVRVGDRLVDNDNQSVYYEVSGVQQNNRGPNRRTEIVCHLPKP